MRHIKKWVSWVLQPRYRLVDLVLTAVVIGVVLLIYLWQFERKLLAAVFQSPLPEVVAAQMKDVPDSQAYRKQYDFSNNMFSRNIPVWEKVLAPYKDKPDIHYLEIGVYEGRSAIWVLENILTHPSARLTSIDIFTGPYKEKYFANIERTGAANQVTTITAPSQIALRGLPLNSFDIIYVDGSHAKDDVLEDAVLSYRLLKGGGTLIFDDYLLAAFLMDTTLNAPTDFPKAAIDPFLQCFEKHFTVIHNSYQLIVRKKAGGEG